MVNSKHSVKMKSTLKAGLGSSSRNINDSQAAPTTSSTYEDKFFFKENVRKIVYQKKKKNDKRDSLL